MNANTPSKILVVDDDPGVLMLLRATLSSTKHEVTCCASPKEAVVQLAKKEFDLILTDYMMPGMTGLDLLEVAATSSPHAIRFLLTATATLEAAVEAMKAGKLDRLIRKPWGTAALLHSVEEAAYEQQVRKAQSLAASHEQANADTDTPTSSSSDASTETSNSPSVPKVVAASTSKSNPLFKMEMLNDSM